MGTSVTLALATVMIANARTSGARVITNIVVAKETVYLLSIYDKSDQETLSQKELDELLKYVDDDDL